MPVPYTPLAIANYFIVNYGKKDGIEHMKLQKLVYCSYGWWLSNRGLDNERLTKEGPEIWKHGPVFSSLYYVLRVYGREPINEINSSAPFLNPDEISEDDSDVANLLKWIWNRYGHLSSFALSEMTHKPGTPWHRVAVENKFRVPSHTKIPDKYIFEEFSSLKDQFTGLSITRRDPFDGKREYA